MIVVTRLNDTQFALNPDLIERINANPDTTIVLVDGARYIVTESLSEVIEMIALYRARVVAIARDMAETPQYAALGLVPPPDRDDPPRLVDIPSRGGHA
ncbi:MAG: flagellar FlbD family protein [Microbacteriaceae bacterium]|nr:flagellar FlbD family protein [Microbacteriaceae bacterium]